MSLKQVLGISTNRPPVQFTAAPNLSSVQQLWMQSFGQREGRFRDNVSNSSAIPTWPCALPQKEKRIPNFTPSMSDPLFRRADGLYYTQQPLGDLLSGLHRQSNMPPVSLASHTKEWCFQHQALCPWAITHPAPLLPRGGSRIACSSSSVEPETFLL